MLLNKKINIIMFDSIDYSEALSFQEKLLKERQQGIINDTLIILEHPPVITLGRRGDVSNILASRSDLDSRGVKIYSVSRGGDVTSHGPGQIVGYVIMDLNNYGRDIRLFVKNIETVFINLLKNDYQIDAQTGEAKYTGVWVGNEKITAIGISVHHGVTMHGFSFNVNTDLNHFNWINPCGLTGKGVTSLFKLTGKEQDMNLVRKQVVKYFCEVFDRQPEFLQPTEVQSPEGENYASA